ncbi:hypothetical protein ABIB57_001738 [Devosia sp. UYZn731]|uniref:hypothetical protein n=1 Tax=Devosia sp. UYZn731 TaxID=3156345 RepID=UPI003391ACD3
MRSKTQLLKSQDRLKAAVEALRDELRQIEDELRQYDRSVPLNDEFFWDNLVPLLAKTSGGLTSAEIQRQLETAGHEINTISLRTFLSRNKARGRLLTFDAPSPARWQISLHTSHLIGGLGVRTVEQPSEWYHIK